MASLFKRSMSDRNKIKYLLQKLDLTRSIEIIPILLQLGFDRETANKFLDSIIKQNLITVNHNEDIKWKILKGKPVLLENLSIYAKMTFPGEKYLYENLTLMENIKSDWWKLILVNIPGFIIGAIITYLMTIY